MKYKKKPGHAEACPGFFYLRPLPFEDDDPEPEDPDEELLPEETPDRLLPEELLPETAGADREGEELL
ncbi:MAG TPA: hypothetical protein DDW27_09815 [Bacteroidales bacterium]|nr:hypothetical protein [Bacteroidales bacterium]